MKAIKRFSIKRSDMVGIGVTNAWGEDLGRIEELVIDKFVGEINYVVLAFGGHAGIGRKHFALPWEALCFNPSIQKFETGLRKALLKVAPGFNKKHWPDLTDEIWQSTLKECLPE